METKEYFFPESLTKQMESYIFCVLCDLYIIVDAQLSYCRPMGGSPFHLFFVLLLLLLYETTGLDKFLISYLQ